MTGGIGGTFDDGEDFSEFIEMCYEKATNYETDIWTDPDTYDTLPEQMQKVREKLDEIYDRGFINPDSVSYQINETIKSYAKKN